MDGSPPEASREDLWRELQELKARVESLERGQRRSTTVFSPPPRISAYVAPPPESSTVPASGSTLDRGKPSALESRIGAQLFNRVGIFAVLAGAAWFLKLAIDRAWVGPGIRIAIGLAVAVGLGLWSERFRRTGSTAFSYTLKALASGIAYLSLWACFGLYHLLPASAVFAAMVVVAVSNALLAWRQDSELLAALALAGGLATPALLSTGSSQQLFLFSYLLLLDIGTLVLMALRPWPRLALGAFSGTTLYLAAWWVSYYVPADRTLTGIFIALFFALFTAAPLLALRRRGSVDYPARVSADHLLLGLPVATGGCALLEVCKLLSNQLTTNALAWVAAASGIVYLALVLFVHSAQIGVNGFARGLRIVHLAMGVAFVALAALLGFHSDGITIGWLVELLALAAAAYRFQDHELASALRPCASALLLLSLSGLLLLDSYAPQPNGASAFLNAHFATYLLGIAAFAAVVAIGLKALHSDAPGGSANVHDTFAPAAWPFLAGFAAIAFSLVALLSVSLQIDLFWHEQLHGLRLFRRPAYVDFTYSAWFMLYGAALMAVGFLRRSAFLRWQALVLIALSIAKVFLYDTSHLQEGYRVLSFLGLGVLLLAISFAYQRDWLALRDQSR